MKQAFDFKRVEAQLIKEGLSHSEPPKEDMTCWIMSDGRFYYESLFNHINTGFNLYEKGIVSESIDERDMEQHWVKCTRSMFGGSVVITMVGVPKAKQLSSIMKLALAHKEEFFDEDLNNSPTCYFSNSKINVYPEIRISYYITYNKETEKVEMEKIIYAN